MYLLDQRLNGNKTRRNEKKAKQLLAFLAKSRSSIFNKFYLGPNKIMFV